MVYRFWNKTDNKLLQQLVPAIAPEAIPYVRRGVMADAWANGVARHSEDNLGILLRKNLDALCEYIGMGQWMKWTHFDALVQDCSISNALAMEIL